MHCTMYCSIQCNMQYTLHFTIYSTMHCSMHCILHCTIHCIISALLVTADGAYHCPVGSIWPFFVSIVMAIQNSTRSLLSKVKKYCNNFSNINPPFGVLVIFCFYVGYVFYPISFFCICIDMVENHLRNTNSNLLMVEKVEWPFCLFQPDHCQAMVYWPLAIYPRAVFSESRIGSNFWKEGVLLWVLQTQIKNAPKRDKIIHILPITHYVFKRL